MKPTVRSSLIALSFCAASAQAASILAAGATGSVGAAAFALIDGPLNPASKNAPVGGVREGVLVNNAANRNAQAIRFDPDGSGAFTFGTIPEPGSTSLLGFALGVMLLRRQRRA